MTTTPTPDNPHTDLLAEYDERSHSGYATPEEDDLAAALRSQIAATDKAERRITDVEAFLADTPEAGWESAALAWRDRAQTAEAARDRLAAELAAAEETAAGHGQMRADLERLVLDLVDRKIPGLIADRDRLAARVETLLVAPDTPTSPTDTGVEL